MSSGLTQTTYNSKEIRASGPPEQFNCQPITVKAGSGVLAEGQIMAQLTADSLWVPYNSAAESTGAEVARGILDRRVDASGATNEPAGLYVRGNFWAAKLVGLTNNAKTSLGTTLKARDVGAEYHIG